MITKFNKFILETNHFSQIFYHGTSSKKLKSIMKNGLKNPYLTDSLEKAEYYSIETINEIGGEPIILQINLDNDKNLQVDFNELDEPVIIEEDKYKNIPNKIQQEYEKYAKLYPETYDKKSDIISINKYDYWFSLNLVHAVYYNGIISPEIIEIYK